MTKDTSKLEALVARLAKRQHCVLCGAFGYSKNMSPDGKHRRGCNGEITCELEAALADMKAGERCEHEKTVNLGEAHFWLNPPIAKEVATMLRCLDCERISIDGGDRWLIQPAETGVTG